AAFKPRGSCSYDHPSWLLNSSNDDLGEAVEDFAVWFGGRHEPGQAYSAPHSAASRVVAHDDIDTIETGFQQLICLGKWPSRTPVVCRANLDAVQVDDSGVIDLAHQKCRM